MSEDLSKRPIRSYVLRQGRITSAQKRAIEVQGEGFIIPFTGSALEVVEHYGRDAPLVLDIGSGMGETTVQIARASPDLDFLGIEVHSPGIGNTLKLIAEQGISNLRLIQHDAVEVVEHMLAPGSLRGVHVFFPDPWPKKRHHKRRLLQPNFVRLLSSRIGPGGYLHCATDWEDYAQQMLTVLSEEPCISNSAVGFTPRPVHRPLTKFERRGMRLGHRVWDLVFTRNAQECLV